jgi:UDP-N-acetylmuramate--alanine ligase
MDRIGFAEGLRGGTVHMVGVKGTGMSALAEILCGLGLDLSGSDVAETFYTDEVLSRLPLRLKTGFSEGNLEPGTKLVIHSAAYSPATNPDLQAAAKRGLPMMLYSEALGALSADFDSSGISGVHGKTTTTALTGTLLKALGLEATVLAGSAVGSFGGKSTLVMGKRFFVAETCEYKKHFLSFHPRRIVLTSVESDHQDFFPTYEDILAAFVEYGLRLSPGGELIYCADDAGAVEAMSAIKTARPDIVLRPYGFTADGDFRIVSYRSGQGRTSFGLRGLEGLFELRVPGRHIALDAAAAIALSVSLLNAAASRIPGSPPASAEISALKAGCLDFSGSKRRAEIVGESGGVLVMDDYAHHPTAIARTLEGLREFYQGRRIIVDFMSHTYSRTKALLEEFAASFAAADIVIINKIYASARENFDGSVDGRLLHSRVALRHPRSFYAEEVMDGLPLALGIIKPGDVFITMGAGDNWRLGRALLNELEKRREIA